VLRTHEIKKSGDEVCVRQRAGVTTVEHEVEPQHARLDHVRVDKLLLTDDRRLLAGADTGCHVQITHGPAQAVHCKTPPPLLLTFVSDIAIFVLKRDVKLQLTNSYLLTSLENQSTDVHLVPALQTQ